LLQGYTVGLSWACAARRVTEAAQAMQNAGLITYRYCQVTIVDGVRLEAAACEDYHITRRIFDHASALRFEP
jgi:hypothetical protein